MHSSGIQYTEYIYTFTFDILQFAVEKGDKCVNSQTKTKLKRRIFRIVNEHFVESLVLLSQQKKN